MKSFMLDRSYSVQFSQILYENLRISEGFCKKSFLARAGIMGYLKDDFCGVFQKILRRQQPSIKKSCFAFLLTA